MIECRRAVRSRLPGPLRDDAAKEFGAKRDRAIPGPALEALARYRALTPLPIDTLARSATLDPAQQKLLLDGIAMAEGESPAAP